MRPVAGSSCLSLLSFKSPPVASKTYCFIGNVVVVADCVAVFVVDALVVAVVVVVAISVVVLVTVDAAVVVVVVVVVGYLGVVSVTPVSGDGRDDVLAAVVFAAVFTVVCGNIVVVPFVAIGGDCVIFNTAYTLTWKGRIFDLGSELCGTGVSAPLPRFPVNVIL